MKLKLTEEWEKLLQPKQMWKNRVLRLKSYQHRLLKFVYLSLEKRKIETSIQSFATVSWLLKINCTSKLSIIKTQKKKKTVNKNSVPLLASGRTPGHIVLSDKTMEQGSHTFPVPHVHTLYDVNTTFFLY